jgi:hypothetical protein
VECRAFRCEEYSLLIARPHCLLEQMYFLRKTVDGEILCQEFKVLRFWFKCQTHGLCCEACALGKCPDVCTDIDHYAVSRNFPVNMSDQNLEYYDRVIR